MTAYSRATGELTVLQVEGEACAVCGRPFRLGDKPRLVGMGIGYQLFAHTRHQATEAAR